MVVLDFTLQRNCGHKVLYLSFDIAPRLYRDISSIVPTHVLANVLNLKLLSNASPSAAKVHFRLEDDDSKGLSLVVKEASSEPGENRGFMAKVWTVLNFRMDCRRVEFRTARCMMASPMVLHSELSNEKQALSFAQLDGLAVSLVMLS